VRFSIRRVLVLNTPPALPDSPTPFSPVHSARKFSTVLGAWLPNKPISTRPSALPLISTSKNTQQEGHLEV